MVSKTEAKSKRLGSMAHCVNLYQTKVSPTGGRYPEIFPAGRRPLPGRPSDPEVLAAAEAKRARKRSKLAP